MAQVTGYTTEALDEKFGDTVSSIRIDDNGQLIITKTSGVEENVGAVGNAEDAVSAAWPIGSVFTHTVSTNPATLLGVGTWLRFGQGRMLISQDPAQTEFDGTGETGGEKTHTLTVAEMPSHNHAGNTGSDGGHSHNLNYGSAAGTSNYVARANSSLNGVSKVGMQEAPDHSHTIPPQGGGQPANNMPPYIVVYMWRRTA